MGDLPTLVLLLSRLERLNEGLVADVCRRHGAAPSDVRVLAVLRHTSDGRSELRPTEIGRLVVQTPGGLTATLGRLERQGRIERVEDRDDRRSRRVALTPEGAAYYDAVLEDILDRYLLAFAGLDVDEALVAVRQLVGAFERFANLPLSTGWSLGELGVRS